MTMTVLEFLCAQAPRSMQGLLTGLLVCHIEHAIPGYEVTRLCCYSHTGCTHIPSGENWVSSLVTGDACVWVPWLSV